ncbi:MAG TPA: cytochrome P450 [Steroidobacteraceae bacterium]|nr:cytochrome P450 [Steroidobacteraceae bacterium]
MVTPTETIGSKITLAQLQADPYPYYRALRQHEPVSWVPAAGRFLVTRYQDVLQIERQPDIFSSVERDSCMVRAIGQTMLRLDGTQHKRIRSAIEPNLRQGTIRSRWATAYQQIVDDLIDKLYERGEMDLVHDFAGVCAATCLGRLLGLHSSTEADLRRWSQAIIDGCGNYADDAGVWNRCRAASSEIEAALDDVIPALRRNADDSIVSSLLHSPENFSKEEIKANVMVIIGGGINEPRDAIATAVHALLKEPDQRLLVENDSSRWMNVFEEAVRWIAPVGMYPRQITRPINFAGTPLEEGARIGVVIASANRDETMFENPDVFDINRTKRTHLAFGGGPHFCLGAWSSRVQVAECALPTLFRRLPKLAHPECESVTWAGWVFRGPLNLPVCWQP